MPHPAMDRRLGRTGIMAVACLLSGLTPAAAQVNVPTPPAFAPDEKDFEGLTSLALGSGARAWGMGGAFLARADDATAASWNPAGLSYLRRPEVSLVGARNSFDRGPAGDFPVDHFEGYTPDFLAAAYPVDFGFVSGAVQLSFQRVFSFRGDRLILGEPFFTSGSKGGFDVLAAGTGLRVFRGLRVGATFNRWFNGYSQDRFRSQGARGLATEQQIEYRLRGWSGNLGVIWSPLESLNLGVVGKTPFTGRLRLRRERRDYFTDPANITTNTNSRDDVRLDLPGAVGVGASWRPRSVLTLSADYTRSFWSEGRVRNFFVLPARLPGQDPPPAPQEYEVLPYPTLDDERRDEEGNLIDAQFDTAQLRLGAEYVVIGDKVKVPLRAGFFTDRQYFADGFGQPPHFIGWSVGTGLILGPILVDLAYVREQGTYPDPEVPGARVSTVFQRFFVSLIYRHGAGN